MTDNEAAVAAITKNIGPVRRDALRCNNGYPTDTEKLVDGVFNYLKGRWSFAEMAADPAGAVQDYRDLVDY